MKQIFKKTYEISKPGLRHFQLFLTTLILLTTLFNHVALLSETTASKGIVFSKDNDAGRGIENAIITRWWNSNHFSPYGNLYFRLAHTLAVFSPDPHEPELNATELIEIKHHFALKLVSLISLTVLCLFLSCLLLNKWWARLLLTNILLQIGLYDPSWVEFIYRAHPDHLLMLTSAFAAYFTLNYTNSKTEENFIRAGLAWGVATAVKRSTVLFIPSLLFLFLSEGLKKESVKKGIRFIGYMLLSYLIIGFPQNFGFYKHIKFLIHESHNTRPPSLHSIIEYLSLMFNQTSLLVLAFIPAHLLMGEKEKKLNKVFVTFLGIAILFVLSSSTTAQHNHHIMPHSAFILVTAIFAIKYLPTLNFKHQGVVYLALGLVTLYFLRDYTPAIKDRHARELECLPEAKNVLQMVKERQKDGQSILARDPYFPFDSSKDMAKQFWGTNMEKLDSGDFRLFGTKREFAKRYLNHKRRDLSYNIRNYGPSTEEFYQIVMTQDEFSTPKAKTYRKIYEDQCGFMLWERL